MTNNISKKFWYSNFNFSNSCIFSDLVGFRAFSNRTINGRCFDDVPRGGLGEIHLTSHKDILLNTYDYIYCRIDPDFFDIFIFEKVTCEFLIHNFYITQGKKYNFEWSINDVYTMFEKFESVEIILDVNYYNTVTQEDEWVGSNFLYVLRDWKRLEFYDNHDFSWNFETHLAIQNLHNSTIMQKTNHKPYLTKDSGVIQIEWITLTLVFNE